MNNTKLSGADLSGVVFDKTALENVDFRGTNLEGVKYDEIALRYFAVSRLDDATMSADMERDLDELRSGQRS